MKIHCIQFRGRVGKGQTGPTWAALTPAAVALCLVLGLVAGVGCANRSSNQGGKGGAAISAPTVSAPDRALVGRIVSVDTVNQLAVIRIVPQLGVPDFFEQQNLISRNEQGHPTAQLQGSGQRQGNILGAYIVRGRPQVDDEVLVDGGNY